MAVSGKGDSRRPLLTTREEFELRDELWRCKDNVRKAEIKDQLADVEQERATTASGLQRD